MKRMRVVEFVVIGFWLRSRRVLEFKHYSVTYQKLLFSLDFEEV